MKDQNKVASTIAKIARKMSDYSYGLPSTWGMYQPKQPAVPKKPKK